MAGNDMHPKTPADLEALAVRLEETADDLTSMASDSQGESDLRAAARCVRAWAKFRNYLLDQDWHDRCRFEAKNDKSLVVIYDDGSEYPPHLRYSHGPKQGYFWDIYGDNFDNEALAMIALSQAPYPRAVGPVVFNIPLAAVLGAEVERG